MLFPIRGKNSQCVIQIPFYIFRIVVGIGKFLVRNGLDSGIHGGFNAQSAGVDQTFRHNFRITRYVDQVIQDLLKQGVGKIGTGSCVGADTEIGVMLLDSFIHGFRVVHGLVIFLLGDKFKLQHLIQAFLAPFGVFFRIAYGIESGRILGDGGDDCGFGKRQRRAGLAEISLGGGFHTQGILAQVDGVHIPQQDFFLGEIFGDFQGQILLLKLTLDHLDQIAVLLGPCGKDGVL